MTSIAACAGVLLLTAVAGPAKRCAAAPSGAAVVGPTRRQLVGAWRLVRIDYSGPRGPMADPFYQPGSTGLLIYDRSGSMSVQIAAPHRRAWRGGDGSRAPSADARNMRAKATAFDTYYAYYGSWSLDAAKSVVTHHVESSLIPAENGTDYTQHVTLEDGRLIFTNRERDDGVPTIRRKIWQRVARSSR